MVSFMRRDMNGFENQYLKVLHPTEKRDIKSSILWRCECKFCGNREWLLPSHSMTRVLGCSKCRFERRKYEDVERSCVICGDRFTCKNNTRTKTCSRECKKKFLAGKVKKRNNSSVENKLRSTISCCLSRRKTREDSHLDIEKVIQGVSEVGWKCCKTGIPFEIKGMFAPSVDRIDSNKPYVEGNIQIVCWIYNRCKQTDTDRDVLFFAQQLCKNQEDK